MATSTYSCYIARIATWPGRVLSGMTRSTDVSMFSENGNTVANNELGRAAVTLDFGSLRSHNADRPGLLSVAACGDIHPQRAAP